jgi:S-methylmethionine-dependent homocysteine/selenocysteine methylase
MKKQIAIAIIAAFFFAACASQNKSVEFVSSTIEEISSRSEILCLEWYSIFSSNQKAATAKIVPGKIEITSIAEGSTIITLYGETSLYIKIAVTVSKSGLITIGEPEYVLLGSWQDDDAPEVVKEYFNDFTFLFIKNNRSFSKGTYSIKGNIITEKTTHHRVNAEWLEMNNIVEDYRFEITRKRLILTDVVWGEVYSHTRTE